MTFAYLGSSIFDQTLRLEKWQFYSLARKLFMLSRCVNTCNIEK